MKLILASSNKHKIAEINVLLDKLPLEVIPKEAIGCLEEIPETGNTLNENAVLKARYIHEKYKVNCFAEDTGLEVNALNGAPGVHTARYAGENRDSLENMQKLLSALEGKQDRSAQFKTVIALMLENKLHLFEGIAEGTIAKEMKGNGGFGYDPVFIPIGFDKSFAELDQSIKNKISHRARAIEKLIQFLQTYV
jgi:XTP/dITP diphosphohydrolase